MYDIQTMRSELENASAVAEKSVRNKFIAAFQELYPSSIIPDEFNNGEYKITSHLISSNSDLESITSGPGFYIILTTYDISENQCLLQCLLSTNKLKAVYRGESATVKKRIQSHLFNKKYKSDYEQRKSRYLSQKENVGKEFYEQFWPACLKLDPVVSGINIDEGIYADYSWMVIVHQMKNSTQEVRVQAELAFDCVFNKPIASRE